MKPAYIKNLESNVFHKMIIGAALQDYKAIEHFAYLYTLAGADAIDVSAFPLSIKSAQQGVKAALEEDPTLNPPLLMFSINLSEDPHFRIAKLDTSICTECLLCIPSCPSLAFNNDSGFNYDSNLCFGCSNCIQYCPVEALKMEAWSPFDLASLSELKSLGANSVEFHIGFDINIFQDVYTKIDLCFELESFCICSEPFSEEDLEALLDSIVGNFYSKYTSDQVLIIQVDGIPMSGATNPSLDKDLRSIENASIVMKHLSNKYPKFSNIFVQLAGGITEKSLQKAHSIGVPVNGVAIGSYARSLVSKIESLAEQKQFMANLLKISRS